MKIVWGPVSEWVMVIVFLFDSIAYYRLGRKK